jgi:hypothetical protein
MQSSRCRCTTFSPERQNRTKPAPPQEAQHAQPLESWDSPLRVIRRSFAYAVSCPPSSSSSSGVPRTSPCWSAKLLRGGGRPRGVREWPESQQRSWFHGFAGQPLRQPVGYRFLDGETHSPPLQTTAYLSTLGFLAWPCKMGFSDVHAGEGQALGIPDLRPDLSALGEGFEEKGEHTVASNVGKGGEFKQVAAGQDCPASFS